MSDHPDVRPGQVWADNDRRMAGRTLRVERVDGGRVLCRILTNSDEAQQDIDRYGPGKARFRDRRGQTVSIALARMRPTSTGYRLLDSPA